MNLPCVRSQNSVRILLCYVRLRWTLMNIIGLYGIMIMTNMCVSWVSSRDMTAPATNVQHANNTKVVTVQEKRRNRNLERDVRFDLIDQSSLYFFNQLAHGKHKINSTTASERLYDVDERIRRYDNTGLPARSLLVSRASLLRARF